jgi:cytochrome c-type protein NapC
MTQDPNGARGRLWPRLRRFALGAAGFAFVAGILFWGGLNTALEMTNKESFCISCHEMRENVFEEYRNTIHYQNRMGVRASCPDCHVPKEWIPKMLRKIQAANELWHHLLGTVATPEEFDAKRVRLAQTEWRRMKANDSRECRNCHNFEYFDYSVRGRPSNKAHQTGVAEGKTCIDCHKGIAHSLPPIEQGIAAGDEAVTPARFQPPAAPKPH